MAAKVIIIFFFGNFSAIFFIKVFPKKFFYSGKYSYLCGRKFIELIMEPIKTYTYDEAFEASLKYFAGDELAARVWVNKYAMKDSFGNIFEQSPEQMHWRISNEVARIEKKYSNPMSAEQVF